VDEWRALGNVIDRSMFLISLIIIVCICVWMMASPQLSAGTSHHADDDEPQLATSGEQDHH